MVNTIYCDFDGVIVNTTKAIVDLYNRDYKYQPGYKRMSWKDVHSYDFRELAGIDNRDIQQYFNRPCFFETVEFIKNSQEVLNPLSEQYNIVIISKGERSNLILKRNFIEQNLPCVDAFVGLDIDRLNKWDFDMSDGALIEDEELTLARCNAKYKIKFGNGYTEDCMSPRTIKKAGIVCCRNWNDVFKTLAFPVAIEQYSERGDI